MKKVFLVLVGIVIIGIGFNSYVEATEKDRTSASVNIEEHDGNASDGTELQQKQRSSVRGTDTRNIELRRFYIEVTDGAVGSVPASMPNTNVSISYSYDNKEIQLYEGKTNGSGEILNLTLKNIPVDITSLKIKYVLGNDERGFIQKFNKKSYQFLYTLSLNSNLINTKGNPKVRFGSQGNEDSYFYNFQAVRINYYFDEAVGQYKENVLLANNLLPETPRFELPPINIHFEKEKYLDKKNGFYRNGFDNDKISNIVIADKSDRIFDEWYLKHNVIHEWSHWNLYKNIGKFGGPYDTHYTYNADPAVSFGEGWPLFVGEMYAKNYDLNNRDRQVQTDNYGGINRLYGKSTNVTVQKVLHDLLDVVSSDEDFSISNRFLDEETNEVHQRKLNLGILHTVMVESKATTLQDFIKYLEKKYVLTKSDKEKFAKLLEVNGLSKDGAFTLDNTGNPLLTPIQFTEEISDSDED